MISFGKFNLTDFADCVVVTDRNVAKLYDIASENVLALPAGERTKSFATVERICRFCLSKNLLRGGKIVAVGGGVVGDVAGFAASVYKRGVKLLHVPTTLLAMVDSSVGGKTAVNLDEVKNACGSFYAADTLVDLRFLSTLSQTEILSGMGEIIKYRMINAGIDNAAEQGLPRLIADCIAFKQAICNVDPYDKGRRMILNAGHTLGHAVELIYDIPHGYAVANGLFHELTLSQKLGLCSDSYAARWREEIASHYPIVKITDEVLRIAAQDKKSDDSGVRFVLATDNGAVIRSFTMQELTEIYA